MSRDRHRHENGVFMGLPSILKGRLSRSKRVEHVAQASRAGIRVTHRWGDCVQVIIALVVTPDRAARLA